jgi:hypothetical protein
MFPMKFRPVGAYKKARARGRADFAAGKSFSDNPYLWRPDKALSSWWQAGYQQAKNADVIGSQQDEHE